MWVMERAALGVRDHREMEDKLLTRALDSKEARAEAELEATAVKDVVAVYNIVAVEDRRYRKTQVETREHREYS